MNIIHQRGTAKTTHTHTGRQVVRQASLYIPEWQQFVECAPYEEHFIYENPERGVISSAYLCTCGSVAVVAPPDPSGMFVCLLHTTTGLHQTSLVNKKDFGQVAGRSLRAGKGRKWA